MKNLRNIKLISIAISVICLIIIALSTYLILFDKKVDYNISTNNYTKDYQGAIPVGNYKIDNLVQSDTSTLTEVPDYYCIRDDYAMYAQNQTSMGLCWAFTSNTVLESALAKKYNEYYDLSEAYIGLAHKMLDNSYSIGDGGHMGYYTDAISHYSLLLECDLTFDSIYGIDDSNYEEILDSLQDQRISIPDTIQKVNFGKNSTANTDIYKNAIKSHILNYSAIYCAIYAGTANLYNGYTVYYNSTDDTGVNHAVTIIGWDDNFTYVDALGTHKGAWIILNSWGNNEGNDGIVYLPYDDQSITDLYGFKLVDNATNPSMYITESSADFDNLYNGKFEYEVDESTLTPNKIQQKNIFYSNQDIDLQYTYSLNDNDYNIYVSFQDKYNSSNDNFTITLNKQAQTIDINSIDDSTDCGTYVLKVQFDYDKDSKIDYTLTKEIFVMSGAEIGTLRIYQLEENNKGGLSSTYDPVLNYNYNSYNMDKQDFDITTDHDGIMVVIELASYSTINSYSISNFTYVDSYNTFSAYSEYDYANGLLYLFAYNFGYRYSVTFNANGQIITYNFSISQATNVYNTYIYYDLNGGTLDNNYSTIQTISSTEDKIYLDTPTKNTYYLEGLYLDNTYQTQILSDNNGYYITIDDLQYVANPNNFCDLYLQSYLVDTQRYYCNIFVKWTKEPASISYGSKTCEYTYGDTFEFDLPTLTNFSNSVEFSLLNAPAFVQLNANSVFGTATIAGNYTFSLLIVDNLKGYNATCTITFNISKRQLEIKIDDKSSDYQQPTQELTYTITNGTIYNNDDLMIEYSTSASNNADVGTYPITAISNNSNYDITFTDGIYTINKIDLPTDLIIQSNYNSTYDKYEHSANVMVNNIDDYTLTYSLNGQDYTSSKPTFKNTCDTKYFVKISGMRNYNDRIVEASVKITPAIINIKWIKTSLIYNGTSQFPQYEFNNPNNEEITLTKKGESTYPKADYSAELQTTNTNYALVNNSTEFDILNADFNVTYNDININYDNTIHELDYVVTSTPTVDYTAQYSLDGIKYTTQAPTFKNAQNTQVYVNLSAQYFNDKTFTIDVNIAPITLNVIWGNTLLKYDGTSKIPSYSIDNPVDEELNIIEIGHQKQYSTNDYQAKLLLTGEQQQNYILNNNTCNFNFEYVPLAVVGKPTISQSQINNAKTLKDIALPQGYSWEDETQEVMYGKNQYTIVYTDEYGVQTLYYVIIDKPEPNYDFIYLILAGVAVLLALIFIFVVIRSKKKASVYSLNSKNDNKSSKNDKVEEFISQSKISKDTKINATPINNQQNTSNPIPTPTPTKQPTNNIGPINKPNVAPNNINKPSTNGPKLPNRPNPPKMPK